MKTRNTSAFTLIELLMVIAIIGILAGILIPAVGSVKKNAKIATSQARISQYLAAIQSFKGEYSYYPFSANLDSNGKLDLSVVANSELFVSTLSARDVSNSVALVATGGNRRRIQFYTFAEDEISDGTYSGVAANTVIDGFGNNQIFIVFDHDNNGVVTVPNPEGGADKEIRSKMTAYVLEDSAGNPDYYLYD